MAQPLFCHVCGGESLCSFVSRCRSLQCLLVKYSGFRLAILYIRTLEGLPLHSVPSVCGQEERDGHAGEDLFFPAHSGRSKKMSSRGPARLEGFRMGDRKSPKCTRSDDCTEGEIPGDAEALYFNLPVHALIVALVWSPM